MRGFFEGLKRPTTVPGADACPTRPCATCGVPLPVVAYDQACPRCRAVMPAAASCPGGCSGCEMGRSS